MLQQTLFSWSI